MRKRAGMLIAVLLGGVIAIPSALQALITVGSDPAYGGRVGFGWVALGAAAICTTASLVLQGRRGPLALTLLLGSIAGTLAINLFYINTFYIVGAQLWLIGAAFLLVDSPRREA